MVRGFLVLCLILLTGCAASSAGVSARSAGLETPSAPPAVVAPDVPYVAPARPMVSAVAKPQGEVVQPGLCDAPAKCVALTFDDGPGVHTSGILDALDSMGAKATFFVVGSNVESHKDLLVRMRDSGMEIGNHTWSHKNLPTISDAAEQGEVSLTGDAIAAAIGDRPSLLRPPYGAFDASTKSLGMPIALWSIDTEDWRTKDGNKTLERVLSQVNPNSVVLLHDIQPSTARVVPEMLSKLKAGGYTMVTFSQVMTARGQLGAGQIYGHG